MTDTKFCCERMHCAVQNPESPVVYTPKFREYGLRILDGGTSTIELGFCPWCGQKLPTSLRDRWFEELERLGIDPVSGDVPPEFSDERWFIERDRM